MCFPLTVMLINVPMNTSWWNPSIPFTEVLSLVNDDRITENPQTKHTYLLKKKKPNLRKREPCHGYLHNSPYTISSMPLQISLTNPGIHELGPNIHFQPCISLQHEVFTPASRFSHSLQSSPPMQNARFEGPSDISILHNLAHIDFSPIELLQSLLTVSWDPHAISS